MPENRMPIPVKTSRYLEAYSLCSRCGGCKVNCPTYGDTLSEAMGARGRLRLALGLLAGEIEPSPLLAERLFSCLLCGACEVSCPLGIDIPDAICRARSLLQDVDRKRRHIRHVARFAAKRPDLAFRIASLGQGLITPKLLRKGIIPFMPDLAEAPFRSSEQVHRVAHKRGRVAFFPGCSVSYLMPHLGDSLLNILRLLGYEVVIPKGVTCCGAPLRALGLEEDAARLAERNVGLFDRLTVDAILSLCPTCTHTLKAQYPLMIGAGLSLAEDVSVFLRGRLPMSAPLQGSSVYHDPCHLAYSLGVWREPRELIEATGVGLIEPGSQGCCGFAGTFCLSFRDLSEGLLDRCAGRLLGTGAETVITSCPGCMLQLGRLVQDRPVIHLVELIEDYLLAGQPEEEARTGVLAGAIRP